MQPSMFPLPFDAQGNLILTGIHSPGGTWSIDSDGNASFTTLSVTNSLLYQGTELSTFLAQAAQGIITLATITGDGTTYDGTNDLLIGRIVIKNFDPTRQYKIGYRCRLDVVASTPTFIDIKCYLKYDADATTADAQLFEHQIQRYSGSATDSGVFIEHPFNDLSPGGTDAHLSVYANASVLGFKIDTTTSGVGARMWVEDIGPAIAYDSWVQSGNGGASPPTTHVKTYSANGSASFQDDGTNRAGFDSGHCFQGYYSSTNGNQYSMITFPYATIQSDLSGATVTKTELYLNNLHWYNNSGGTAVIGTHNQTSVSGNHAYSQVTDNINQFSWSLGQAKWVTLNNSIGNAFKNNTAKGIALGKGQTAGGTLSNSHTYYGYFAGNGQSGEPQLRITYTK